MLDDKMTNYDDYNHDYLTKANKRWTRGKMALYLVTTMIVDEPLSASTDGRGGYQPAGRSETKQLTLFPFFYFGDNLMCLPGLARSSKPREREKTASLATRFFPLTSTVTMRPAGG